MSQQSSQQQQQPAHRMLRVAVSGAANNGSGLVRVTTVAPHRFQTGNKILVANVGGTTEANGLFTVTVISPTSFDLQGSTFTNAYTSGGVATRPLA